MKMLAIRKIDKRRLEQRWCGDNFSMTIARAAMGFMGQMQLLHEETHLSTDGRPPKRTTAAAGTGRRSKPDRWVQVQVDDRVYSILETVADLWYARNPKAKAFARGKRLSYALIVASLTHVSTSGLLELVPKSSKHHGWALGLWLRDWGSEPVEYVEDPLDLLELAC